MSRNIKDPRHKGTAHHMRRNWVDFRVLRREYFELRHIRKGGENDIYYLDRRTYRLTLEIFICKLKIWSTCIVQLLVKIIIKLNWVDAEKAWIQSALKAIRGCENDILFFNMSTQEVSFSHILLSFKSLAAKESAKNKRCQRQPRNNFAV